MLESLGNFKNNKNTKKTDVQALSQNNEAKK